MRWFCLNRELMVAAKKLMFILLIFFSSCGALASGIKPPYDIFRNIKSEPIDEIIIFGDSLSDRGNFFTLADTDLNLSNIHLQSPPAGMGGLAFSDGYLAVEYIGAHYGVDIVPAWHSKSDYKPSANLYGSSTAKRDKDIVENIFLSRRHFRENSKIPKIKSMGRNVKHYANFMKNTTRAAKYNKGGNNFAVANATIYPKYPGLVNIWFNEFALEHQIDLYQKNVTKVNPGDSKLHIIILGGNDLLQMISGTGSNSGIDIGDVVAKMDAQIARLQKSSGAKKIFVAGTPDLGSIPIFNGTGLQTKATQMSKQLNQQLGKLINGKYKQKEVYWFPIIDLVNKELKKWPVKTRNKACVSDISNGYDIIKEIIHFITHDEELPSTYINECSEDALKNGEYPFYNYFHGSQILYQTLAKNMILEIDKFMKM